MQTAWTMKELPEDERPYEKCLMYGAGALSDAELLAVMLRTGSKGESALSLARRLLSEASVKKSLSGLCHLSREELCRIRGIGTVKAVQIQCLGELSRRMAKTAAGEQLCFRSPKTVADYYMEDLRHEEQEQLLGLFLNTKSVLLKETVLFKGTVNSSVISPREIFIEALKQQAVQLILVHNHPSGDPAPSREDILATRQIQEAGELIGIRLSDHIIIGDRRYTSLREKKLL